MSNRPLPSTPHDTAASSSSGQAGSEQPSQDVYGNQAMINSVAVNGDGATEAAVLAQTNFADLQPNEQRPCTVVFEYDAAHDDELTLKVGMPVVVLEASDDGWVRGRNDHTGDIGWFHGSFVQADTDASYVETRRAFTPSSTAQSKSTLKFEAKERLRVLAQPNEQWWMAQRLTGNRDVGFVPRIYVISVAKEQVKKAPTPRPRGQSVNKNKKESAVDAEEGDRSSGIHDQRSESSCMSGGKSAT